MNDKIRLFRGRLAFMTGDPDIIGNKALTWYDDGLLAVNNGYIIEAGHARSLLEQFPPDIPVRSFGQGIIIPGFVDTHIHYPQLGIIASYGEKLLEWLDKYAFPAEIRLQDTGYARLIADLFIDELLRNGTTTANVFSTVHPHTSDILFEAAIRKNMRIITGKVLMDRNAPTDLLDTPERARSESAELIRKWHGKGRLGYAVAPRFAVTSTPEQLKTASWLLREFGGVLLHTHLSENRNELELIRKLYPDRSSYWDVYDHHGLTGEHSIFAHGVHLSDEEFTRLAASGSALSFCPSSNLYLGSGLFRYQKACDCGIRIGIGSDIGAGTSFSIPENLNEAYKIARIDNALISPEKAFYMSTLGGAAAIKLDDRIGTFKPGYEADFIVLDPEATRLLARRTAEAATFRDLLFPLLIMGDDRIVNSTYIMGESFHERDASD